MYKILHKQINICAILKQILYETDILYLECQM